VDAYLNTSCDGSTRSMRCVRDCDGNCRSEALIATHPPYIPAHEQAAAWHAVFQCCMHGGSYSLDLAIDDVMPIASLTLRCRECLFATVPDAVAYATSLAEERSVQKGVPSLEAV
jgi:hypothetical protein